TSSCSLSSDKTVSSTTKLSTPTRISSFDPSLTPASSAAECFLSVLEQVEHPTMLVTKIAKKHMLTIFFIKITNPILKNYSAITEQSERTNKQSAKCQTCSCMWGQYPEGIS